MTNPYIIPLFIPHQGCTHACAFCNQQLLTGQTSLLETKVYQEQVKERLAWGRSDRPVEVAFYGGSFTALPWEKQQALINSMQPLLQSGQVQSLRLSTRPDALQSDEMEWLVQHGVRTVELGVQSMDDKVLAKVRRGHEAAAVYEAVACLRKFPVQIGVQLLLGLPEEDWPSLRSTALAAAALAPDFVRIYATVILENTLMAQWYRTGAYQPLELSEAVQRAAFLVLWFLQQNIPVIRTGLQATTELDAGEELLAGPYHPAFGELVQSLLFGKLLQQAWEQLPSGKMTVYCHRRDESKLRGLRNRQYEKLQKQRPFSLQVKDTLPRGSLLISIDEWLFCHSLRGLRC